MRQTAASSRSEVFSAKPDPASPTMNRVLVLYHSNSGNTKHMAEFVAEGAQQISETEVRLRSIDEATADDVVWCDGIAVSEHGPVLSTSR